MEEDILSLILQAETEYRSFVEKAAEQAEGYAAECKERREAYIETLKQELNAFEKDENESLALTLAENERAMENEAAELKERLRACQAKKAEAISDRLAKEVLSLTWR